MEDASSVLPATAWRVRHGTDSPFLASCLTFRGGIPQNGAVGCQYHHEMLDNGSKGKRDEMLEIFRSYLKDSYPDWDEKNLVYDKWKKLIV